MIVPINDKWRIESTAFAWEVQECKTVPEVNEKTGKPNKNPGTRWVARTWHGTFTQALQSHYLSDIRASQEALDVRAMEERIMAEIARIGKLVEGKT